MWQPYAVLAGILILLPWKSIYGYVSRFVPGSAPSARDSDALPPAGAAEWVKEMRAVCQQIKGEDLLTHLEDATITKAKLLQYDRDALLAKGSK